MKGTRSRKGRFVALLAISGLFAIAAYAFTASNTVPDTRAGDGAGAITGYTVTNVTYNLDALDPTKIASYEFDLDATAKTVKAKTSAAQATYDTCANTVLAPNHWTCTPAVAPAVLATDNLRVIAVQ